LSLLRTLALAAALAVLSPAAFAQLREGLYNVEGQNPDGSAYEGVGNAQIIGLGLIQSGLLALSFTVEGRPGIAIYGVEPDGKLRGTWTSGGGLGTEILTVR
jgi:hypothetical protein